MKRTLGLAALGVSLVDCSPSEPRSSLEIVVQAGPSSLDPRFTTDAFGMKISRLAHLGLVRLDPTSLKPVPAAASSWSWDGPLSLSLQLRTDVSFASGAPLEATDVCATLNALASPSLGSPHKLVVESIASCEAPSAHEVRLTLKAPRATLLTDLEVPILRRDQVMLPPDIAGHLDGLGPFIITSFDNQGVSLQARAGGVLPKPAHDVDIRVVHDENARVVRLLAGRTDVIPNGVTQSMLPSLEQQGAIAVVRPAANLTYLLLNHEHTFRDRLSRMALSSAIDRDLLIRTLLGGKARVATSILPPESWAVPHTEEAKFPGYDPDRARRLLDATEVPSFTLLTSTDRARVVMGRAMAQMLRDAGFKVELSSLDLGALLQRLTKGDYSAAMLQFPELTEPNVLRYFFHSSAIPGRGGFGVNRSRYENGEVDAWLDDAARTPDESKRAELYAKVLTTMAHDVAVVPLFHEDQVALVSPRAKAFSLSAEGRWLSIASVP
ncbi:MAG: ABC transporter substrate-binding protein [Polyangiaceae bacterium]